jgi:Plasmid replication region DNA-binding N-term
MKDTYTLAFEACGAYFTGTGKMPTVEAIKAEIGIKSPTTISTAIKDWKAGLAKSMDESKAAIPGIPPALTAAFVAVWQQAQAAATDGYQERLAQLAAREAQLAAQAKELEADQARTGHLVELTERRCQEEILFLKKELARLAEESAQLREESALHRNLATAAEKQCAVYGEQIRQETEKLKRLETQYDREHDWSLKRIEEEKENHRKNTEQEMKRLQGETNRSKLALEVSQAKVAQLAHQALADQERIIGLERSLSDEKVKQASLLLNEANYQNEINVLQERIRLLITKGKKNNVSK